ncbi:hypothetical protein [Clostridium cylindrosporum]|uniref:Uncharacterized protein n=1 Tax=Clostridium cylindrosporum DSM 605 TaxID=1121307 RepID=A0A0J8G5M6_CLOCY|nr:hypothetical protein [Clostridium cylindrosporum]KMT22951.1 hypothetical protein CLCY_5c01900 [Clostridium cylindrosporum DSM 605]
MSKKIYLLLTRTGTRFSSMIYRATGYEYTHASIALDKDLKELYSFGRRNMMLPFIAGFVREDLNSGVYKKYDNTKCVIYELDVTEETYENIKKLINVFEEHKHTYKYNFIGLPLILFNIPYKRERHFVCSQFVAYVLLESGAAELDKEFTMVKPRDFLNIVNKRLIYNGFLRQYTYPVL